MIRHLESIIGVGAVNAGLRRFLKVHSNTAPSTSDMIRCWEAAAGRDLTDWTTEWLMSAGVNTLDLVLVTSPDGLVRSAEILQSGGIGGRLRTHHLPVQAFDATPSGLTSRPLIDVTACGPATPVHPLVGSPSPALVVLNAPARTYAKIRLDERSRATLAISLGDLDPDIRAACWVAGREMVKDNLMPPAEFHRWVARHRESETDPQIIRQLDV